MHELLRFNLMNINIAGDGVNYDSYISSIDMKYDSMLGETTVVIALIILIAVMYVVKVLKRTDKKETATDEGMNNGKE